jgi:hypothetical protein
VIPEWLASSDLVTWTSLESTTTLFISPLSLPYYTTLTHFLLSQPAHLSQHSYRPGYFCLSYTEATLWDPTPHTVYTVNGAQSHVTRGPAQRTFEDVSCVTRSLAQSAPCVTPPQMSRNMVIFGRFAHFLTLVTGHTPPCALVPHVTRGPPCAPLPVYTV